MNKIIKRSIRMFLLGCFSIAMIQISTKMPQGASSGSKTTVKAPEGLRSKRKSTASIQLSWKKQSSVSGYVIYRWNKKKKAYEKKKTISKASTQKWTNKKLKKNTIYTYRIKAYKKSGSKKIYSPYSYKVMTITNTKKCKTANAAAVSFVFADAGIEKGLPLGQESIFYAHASAHGKKLPGNNFQSVICTSSNTSVMSARAGTAGGVYYASGDGKGSCYLILRAHNGLTMKKKVTVKSYVMPDSFQNLNKMSAKMRNILIKNKSDMCAIIEEFAKYRYNTASVYLWKGRLTHSSSISLGNCKEKIQNILTREGISEIRIGNLGTCSFISYDANGKAETIRYWYRGAITNNGLNSTDTSKGIMLANGWEYLK